MKKIYKSVFLFILLSFLIGCSKPNPLMSGEARNYLERYVDDKDSYGPECGAYYAGYTQASPELLKKCDRWFTFELRVIKGMNYDMSSTPTLENFRDPQLWKMLMPQKPAANT